jgi:hypothetical protein
LSIAIAACDAMATALRSARSPKTPVSGVPKNKAADDLAGARDDRHGEVAAHRQVALRLPWCGPHLAVARIDGDVVDATGPLAVEGRLEDRRGARHAEALERLARRARERIELVDLAVASPRCCRRTRRSPRR